MDSIIVVPEVKVLVMESRRKMKEYGNVITFWLGPIPTVHILDFETAKEEMIGNGAAYADRYTPYALDVKRGATEYGNVITFWLGPIPTVHILDYETAKEEMIVNGAAYADRYTPYVLDVKREGRGTVFSNGDFWADHRRFTLRTLRDFALKNSIMEERIMDEVRYKKEDIATGKHSLDGDGDDFVDAFLIKMEKDRREGRHPTQAYKEDELLYDVFDLWIGGHETTAITVMWGFMHLIKDPSIMEKIRAELNVITNGNRPVSLSDKEHTPYLNWTVLA
ncbi:hypothetical protein TELCIR_08353, partial [Teladorsagia circumcincta]